MEKYKLEDICSLITDGTHQTPVYCEDGGYIFLSSKDVTSRKIDWENTKYIPEELHEKLYSRLKPQVNDILLAKNGTTGVAAIVDKDIVFDIYVSLALLRPEDIVYSKYLLYFINSPVAKRQFNKGLKGIGVPNLHLSTIRKTELKLPNIDKQKEISGIFDILTGIIEKRQKQLDSLDDLIKSRFVEMFGDPITNSMSLPLIPLGEACNMKAGKSIKACEIGEEYIEGLFLCYGGNGIRGYVKDYTHEGDMPLIGRQGALCGNVQYASGKFYATEHAVVTQPKLGWNPYWLFIMLREMNLNRLASGAAQPGLNVGTLVPLDVINPPIDQQNQFTIFVQQVDKLKVEVQKSLDEIQILFDSLMQRYFE